MPEYLSDSCLFPLLQSVLFVVLLLALLMEFIAQTRAGFGEAGATVTRGDKSMAIFYAIYAAVSGVLVALCLSVDWAKDHRVFWVLLDTFITSYLCLMNPWFRNNLLAFAVFLTKVESR
jgi:type III secretory pathway component EscS